MIYNNIKIKSVHCMESLLYYNEFTNVFWLNVISTRQIPYIAKIEEAIEDSL